MQQKQREDMILNFLSTVRLVIGCLIVAVLVKSLILKPVHVKGDSMYPTLQNNDVGISNVFTALTGGVDRFDVVVAKDFNSDVLIVKRIIGLPGERVEYRDEKLYIDGEHVKEPFLNQTYMKKAIEENGYFTKDVSAVVLGNDEYFIVGDNRVKSLDSRAMGPCKASDIISKDVYVFFPFSRFSFVMNAK